MGYFEDCYLPLCRNGKPSQTVKAVSDCPCAKLECNECVTAVQMVSDEDAYVVLMSDGSLKITPKENVTLADKNNPQPQAVAIEKEATVEPSDFIVPTPELPEGTKLSFAVEPDIEKVGKSTVVIKVEYPDGSVAYVESELEVLPSLADINDPQPQDVVIKKGNPVEPSDFIANVAELPEGTEFSFVTDPDTETAGKSTVTVKVEYTDGSVAYVESELEIVVPLTDEYDPQGKTVTIEKGTPVKVTDFIVAPEELPEGTQLEFYPEPNVDIEGTRNVGVRVTYPDGSMDYVRSSITVTEPPTDEALGDIYEPQVQELTVEKGADVKPIDFITNASDLPEGTIFTYDFEPDVDTVGESYASVVVAYPDGSMDYVHVTLTVTEPPAEDNEPLAELYQPQVEINKTIYKGAKIEAIEFITNVADLPEGTTFSYDFAPDLDTLGESYTRIMITYPDGSTDYISVPFEVIDHEIEMEDQE